MTAEVQGHAASNAYWVSFSVPAKAGLRSGLGHRRPERRVGRPMPAYRRSGHHTRRYHEEPGGFRETLETSGARERYGPHLISGDCRSDDRGGF